MIPTDSGLEAEFSMEKEAVPVPEDPPFHVLFMGDYSGRENLSRATGASLPEPSVREIDRDNFDAVMRKLNVSLRLDLSDAGTGSHLVLSFSELEDFHPDRIYEKVRLFSDLRETRRRLLDHDTYETAAREVRSWLGDGDETARQDTNDAAATSPSPPDAADESTGDLLGDILSGRETGAAAYEVRSSGPGPDIGSFIRDIVRPHVIHTDEREQGELVAFVDETAGRLMRKILHHPHFQALEAAWRGLWFVVRRAETDRDLRFYLLDISFKEIREDLRAVDDLTDSDLFGLIVRRKAPEAEGEPYALLCGNYRFEAEVEDVATLIRLAKIGGTINAPFVSELTPGLFGIEGLEESPTAAQWEVADGSKESKLWTTLRTVPEAPGIGLALPRFLLRLPYGADTDPAERFEFEEFEEVSEHEHYLWGNPSFPIALLLAQSFKAHGWEIGSGLFSEVDGLPTHIFQDHGRTRTKSCAEADMTHEGCERLIEQGLMPLISFRDSDGIRLAALQSVAFPSKPLRGRWE